jgi:hypothetical protein
VKGKWSFGEDLVKLYLGSKFNGSEVQGWWNKNPFFNCEL